MNSKRKILVALLDVSLGAILLAAAVLPPGHLNMLSALGGGTILAFGVLGVWQIRKQEINSDR